MWSFFVFSMSTYAFSCCAETSRTIPIPLQYRRRDPGTSWEFLNPKSKPSYNACYLDSWSTDLRGECYVFSLVFCNSDPFQFSWTSVSWNMDGSGSSCSRFQNHCLIPFYSLSTLSMKTESTLGVCPEARNKKKNWMSPRIMW